MQAEPVGRRLWVIPGGWIPADGSGPEPAFTSRDELWLLNTGGFPARVEITIYYEEWDPVGPYRLAIPPRRVRCVRVNDLIDPEALPLETNYAAVVRSAIPIVLQVARYDTRRAANAMSWSLPFAADP